MPKGIVSQPKGKETGYGYFVRSSSITLGDESLKLIQSQQEILYDDGTPDIIKSSIPPPKIQSCLKAKPSPDSVGNKMSLKLKTRPMKSVVIPDSPEANDAEDDLTLDDFSFPDIEVDLELDAGQAEPSHDCAAPQSDDLELKDRNTLESVGIKVASADDNEVGSNETERKDPVEEDKGDRDGTKLENYTEDGKAFTDDTNDKNVDLESTETVDDKNVYLESADTFDDKKADLKSAETVHDKNVDLESAETFDDKNADLKSAETVHDKNADLESTETAEDKNVDLDSTETIEKVFTEESVGDSSDVLNSEIELIQTVQDEDTEINNVYTKGISQIETKIFDLSKNKEAETKNSGHELDYSDKAEVRNEDLIKDDCAEASSTPEKIMEVENEGTVQQKITKEQGDGETENKSKACSTESTEVEEDCDKMSISSENIEVDASCDKTSISPESTEAASFCKEEGRKPECSSDAKSDTVKDVAKLDEVAAVQSVSVEQRVTIVDLASGYSDADYSEFDGLPMDDDATKDSMEVDENTTAPKNVDAESLIDSECAEIKGATSSPQCVALYKASTKNRVSIPFVSETEDDAEEPLYDFLSDNELNDQISKNGLSSKISEPVVQGETKSSPSESTLKPAKSSINEKSVKPRNLKKSRIFVLKAKNSEQKLPKNTTSGGDTTIANAAPKNKMVVAKNPSNSDADALPSSAAPTKSSTTSAKKAKQTKVTRILSSNYSENVKRNTGRGRVKEGYTRQEPYSHVRLSPRENKVFLNHSSRKSPDRYQRSHHLDPDRGDRRKCQFNRIISDVNSYNNSYDCDRVIEGSQRRDDFEPSRRVVQASEPLRRIFSDYNERIVKPTGELIDLPPQPRERRTVLAVHSRNVGLPIRSQRALPLIPGKII